MADPADVAATKQLRKEFNKRMLDLTRTDLRVTHGVAYIRGAVGLIKGGALDARAEVELIARVMRGHHGIKDFVIDCTFRT